MKVWIVILGLQLLHYSTGHEDPAVTTDNAVSTVATDSAGTTVAADSVGTDNTESTEAQVTATTVTQVNIVDVLSKASCCSLRHCPNETTICIENTEKWGCMCDLTEEQKKMREAKAKAVREKYGIKEKQQKEEHHHH